MKNVISFFFLAVVAQSAFAQVFIPGRPSGPQVDIRLCPPGRNCRPPIPGPRPPRPPRPPVPVPGPIPGGYGPADAFRDLSAHENSDEDARGNLALVNSAVQQTRLPLHALTRSFIQLQTAVGGSNQTQEARTAFGKVTSRARLDRLDDLTHALVSLIRSENAPSDAYSALELIDQAARVGYDYPQAAASYQRILEASGGSNQTQEALKVARLAYQVVQQWGLEEITQSAVQLIRAENSVDDAVGNFQLVLRVAQKYGNLESATYDFLSVLQQAGGSNETQKARANYRAI